MKRKFFSGILFTNSLFSDELFRDFKIHYMRF